MEFKDAGQAYWIFTLASRCSIACKFGELGILAI